MTRLHYEPDAFDTRRKNERDFLEQRFGTNFNHIRELATKSQGEVVSSSKQLFDSESKELEAAARLPVRKDYNAYKAIYYDQVTFRREIDAYNSGLVVQAIAQLPHLKEIIVNFEDGVLPHTEAYKRANKYSLTRKSGYDGGESPYGVMQLYSVLCGVASAGIKLKSLKCGKIDWKFLKVDETKMITIKRAFKYLENLRIMFYVGEEYLEAAEFERGVRDCGLFLANYGMCELLSAAEGLQSLRLYIERSGGSELKYMVGTTTWACLRVVALDKIHATESTLVAFVQRHAGTLKELELNNISLLQGCWTSALPSIRNAVKLEELRAHGMWKSYAPVFPWPVWIVNTSKSLERYQKSTLDPPFKLGMAVDRYIREGGECPLWDHDTYPLLAGYSP